MEKQKKTFIIILFALVAVLSSCATTISVNEVQEYKLPEVNSRPLMDFIGYKMDTELVTTASSASVSTNEYSTNIDAVAVTPGFTQANAVTNIKDLGQLGQNLADRRIANNKAYTYLQDYSLKELELYKSENRYLTFVEVAKNNFIYKDNKVKQFWFGVAGIGLAVTSIPFLISAAIPQGRYDRYGDVYSVGYGPNNAALLTFGLPLAGGSVPLLITAFRPSKTEVDFEGAYNIYVYDTATKSIIVKDTVNVEIKDTFKGSYTYNDESRDLLDNYISKHIHNALIKKYDEINKWLKNRR